MLLAAMFANYLHRSWFHFSLERLSAQRFGLWYEFYMVGLRMNKFAKNVCRLMCATMVLSGALFADPSPDRTELAQGLVYGLGTKLLWKNERNPEQRDVLEQPLNMVDSLEYKDMATTLFFTRAAKLTYGVGDFVDLAEVKDIADQALYAVFIQNNFAPGAGQAPDSFDDPDGYEAWQADAQDVASQLSTDIKTAVNNITFQEHRIGAVLEKEWAFDRFFISARTWLGLAERNYWLDGEYRDSLTRAMKQIFPKNDGTFNISDYIGTNWGMGDLHVKFGMVSPVLKDLTLRTGTKIVLPTAGQKKRNTAHKLIPLVLSQFQSYGQQRLNEVLISPQLGNNGHYGVGIWNDVTWKQHYCNGKHELKLQALASMDYLFESAEERLLMRYIDPSFTPDATTFAGGTADETYRSYIGQYVLPEPVDLIIAPGAIVRLGATAQYSFEHAQFFLGYDWYYKSKEQIGGFAHPEDAPVYSPVQQQYPIASTQHTVHGGISHNALHKNVPFLWYTLAQVGVSASLRGTVSFSSVGMGNEFGLGVTVGLKY